MFIGVLFRMSSVFLVTFGGKYTLKERTLMSISWGPKGTVTAALSGVLATTFRNKGD